MKDDYNWTPHLQEGERVLWQGRPRRLGFVWPPNELRNFAIFLVILALPLLKNDGPSFVAWYSLTTIFASFYLVYLAFRVVADKKKRGRSQYAVTTKRALVANEHVSYLDAKFDLGPGRYVFTIGTKYPYVVFSKDDIATWKSTSQKAKDGPPQRRSSTDGVFTVFLDPAHPEEIEKIAQAAMDGSTP